MTLRLTPEIGNNVVLTSSDHYDTTLFPAANVQNPIIGRPWRAAAGGAAAIVIPGISASETLKGILFYGLVLNGQTLTVKDGTTTTTVVASAGSVDANGLVKIWVTPGLGGPGNNQESDYDLTVSGSLEWSIGSIYYIMDALAPTGDEVDLTPTKIDVTTDLLGTVTPDQGKRISRTYIRPRATFNIEVEVDDNKNAGFIYRMLTGLSGIRDRTQGTGSSGLENMALLHLFEDLANNQTEKIWPIRLLPEKGANQQLGQTSSTNMVSIQTFKVQELV